MPSRKGGSTQVEATDDHAAASQPERCTDALHILARLLVRTHLDESVYVDAKGDRFTVLATDVIDTTAVRTSIMPDGLLDTLTDQEIRDLVAFLTSRK